MIYVCSVCGFVYDEVQRGPFAELPDSWTCPLCGASRSAFAPKKEETPNRVPVKAPAEPLKELNAGELSVVFSNLARGCEKQYRPEDQEAFQKLADYFAARTQKPQEADFNALVSLIARNLQEDYPMVKAVAAADGDRGTQRICVWGEKVTRMLDNLLSRYAQEGEAMLEHTQIWVCTVCGFVYLGDEPPKLCPVCKVPDWKFEKVTGRDGK